MDFDFARDGHIFDGLLARRQEIIPETLKDDIQNYYLPYIHKLIDLKNTLTDNRAVIVGVSAIQGTGKSTQGEVLEILLGFLGFQSVSLSIDDHYLTHYQLCQLRFRDPRFIRRGVTHDIPLAIQTLTSLQYQHQPIIVPGYDKGAHHGDGERYRFITPAPGLFMTAKVVDESLMIDQQDQIVKALRLSSANYLSSQIELNDNCGSAIPLVEPVLPADLIKWLLDQGESEITISTEDGQHVNFSGNGAAVVEAKLLPRGWRLVYSRPDFVFYDGWMLGVSPVIDESVFESGLPALETEADREFARLINHRLVEYQPLWQLLDFLTVLYVPSYQDSLLWRDQAEDVLRAKGQGMSHQEIKEFVYYFWRSVHPGIHIRNLAHDNLKVDQVIIINHNHTVNCEISCILSPTQVAENYP